MHVGNACELQCACVQQSIVLPHGPISGNCVEAKVIVNNNGPVFYCAGLVLPR